MNWKELEKREYGNKLLLPNRSTILTFVLEGRENNKNFSQDSQIPAKIQTKHLLNISLEGYYYISQFAVHVPYILTAIMYLGSLQWLHVIMW